jgi:hypothetical protein
MGTRQMCQNPIREFQHIDRREEKSYKKEGQFSALI